MGNIGFLTSILISSGIAFYYSKKVSRGTIALIASILIIDVIIIGSYFGLERLGERFEQTSGAITGRVELHAYHAEILQDHIWVGSGAGTYEMTMPRYRDRHIHSKPTHAENDYIELLIELGFIGTLPMLLILINGIQAQISLLRLNEYHFERGIAFGCLTGTVAILIHGFGDVNHQIPANALLFVLMLALPAAIQQHRRY